MFVEMVFALTLLLFLLDGAVKWLNWDVIGCSWQLFPNVRLDLVRTYNRGFGLGAAADRDRWTKIVVQVLNMVLLAIYTVLWAGCGASMLWVTQMGALGNLLDRLLYGHVIDWIRLSVCGRKLPVINLADLLVSGGLAFHLMAYYFFVDDDCRTV
jgi:signal peptidase II